MKQLMQIEPDLAKDLMFAEMGEVEDGWPWPWSEVDDEIIDQTRWFTHHRKIIHRTDDDTYWRFDYALGSTEYQDHPSPSATLTRVYPHRVVRTAYRTEPPKVDGGAADLIWAEIQPAFNGGYTLHDGLAAVITRRILNKLEAQGLIASGG